MVGVDLLDIGSTTQASALKTQSAEVPGSFIRGDVVLAKYAKTNCFYWAKILKLYKDRSGEHTVDVQWLRPLAGVAVEKSYVLHDGYDETLHGDALKLSVSIRRPCAAEITAAAPPGASASASPVMPAKAGPRVAEMADLLGELIVDQAPEPDSIGSSMFFPPLQSLAFSPQPPLHANTQSSAKMQTPGGPVGYGWLNAGSNMGGAAPWSTGRVPPPSSSSPWPAPSPSQAGMAQSCVPQNLQSNAKPVTAAAPFNELQAAFASNLVVKPSERKGHLLSNINVSQSGRDKQFDFISDMMSGALVGGDRS